MSLAYRHPVVIVPDDGTEVQAVVYDLDIIDRRPVIWESKAPIPMFADVRVDIHIAEECGVITEHEATTLLKRLGRIEYAWRNQAIERVPVIDVRKMPRAIPLVCLGVFGLLFWWAAWLQLAEWFWEVVR